MVKYPAAHTVHTPSGPTHACLRHTLQLSVLMHKLGCQVHVAKAPRDAECANCVNEAKAKGEPS